MCSPLSVNLSENLSPANCKTIFTLSLAISGCVSFVVRTNKPGSGTTLKEPRNLAFFVTSFKRSKDRSFRSEQSPPRSTIISTNFANSEAYSKLYSDFSLLSPRAYKIVGILSPRKLCKSPARQRPPKFSYFPV